MFLPGFPILPHWLGAGSPAPQEVGAGAGNLCLIFPQFRIANVWPAPELGPTLMGGGEGRSWQN